MGWVFFIVSCGLALWYLTKSGSPGASKAGVPRSVQPAAMPLTRDRVAVDPPADGLHPEAIDIASYSTQQSRKPGIELKLTLTIDGVEQDIEPTGEPSLRFRDVAGDDFVGEHASSPSGRFTLGMRRSHLEDRGGGTRTVAGGVALFEGSRCRWHHKVAGPTACAVADDGTSVVTDVQGNKLQTHIRIFSVDGVELFDGRRTAIAFNCGISPDGTIAVCQMCNSRSDTGGRLLIISTRTGKELGRPYPPDGWAEGYEFDTANRTITLLYTGHPPQQLKYKAVDALAHGDAPLG